MKNLLRALAYFRADAPRLLLVFFILAVSIGLNVLKPWPLALIVDSVFGSKQLPSVLESFSANKTALIALLSGMIFVLHFAHGGFSALQNFLSIKTGLRGLTRVRSEVFSRLQCLSLRYYQGTNSGELIFRASWDTYAFQTLFQQGMITFATSVLSLLLMVFVMANLNVRLTLAALALVPLLLLVIKIFGRRMSQRATAAQQADSTVTSLVQQSIAAMPLIQSYTREELEKKRFQEKVFAAEACRISQHGFELLYWFALAILFGLGATTITWLGAGEVLAGRLSVGELLIFIAYLAQLYEPLNQLSQVGATVSGATASTRRVFEILDAPEEVVEKKSAQNRTVRGDIDFKNVSFAYESGHEILHQINFSVKAGERIAIVGPSGAGKTTVLNLLPRFFDPTSGTVELDGVDLREYSLNNLRAQIGLVLQQPILLSASIAENIAYGKPDATREEIEKAARLANADEFIQRAPRKYETLIGEGAARLSIGEQQRINLARAFLKDAPILLLDEPTSALDSESENLVLSGIERLTHGRTTLIVAHRLNMVLRADKILVLDGGKVIEFGTHDELIGRSGYYSRVLQDLRPTVST